MQTDRGQVRQEFGRRLLQHLDALFGFALVLTRSQAEAEDLIQQTYVQALEDPDRFQEGTNMKAWLLAILRNLWINQKRAEGIREYVLFEEEEPQSNFTSPPDSPEMNLQRKMDRMKIRRAIEGLSEIHREVVVLRDLQGLSYREIADVLSCPIGTVMSRLGRRACRVA